MHQRTTQIIIATVVLGLLLAIAAFAYKRYRKNDAPKDDGFDESPTFVSSYPASGEPWGGSVMTGSLASFDAPEVQDEEPAESASEPTPESAPDTAPASAPASVAVGVASEGAVSEVRGPSVSQSLLDTSVKPAVESAMESTMESDPQPSEPETFVSGPGFSSFP